jgi:ribosomal protein S3AE
MIKKKYFDIKLEILNTTVPVLASNQESLNGRIIKFDLTRILRGKGCEAQFLVKKDQTAEIISFKIQTAYIKRIIGYNIGIVEDSFEYKGKDFTMIFKPFMITRKKVTRSVKKALRSAAKDLILKFVADKTREKMFQAVISATLQKAMGKKLKKIYPLAVCELRVLKVKK